MATRKRSKWGRRLVEVEVASLVVPAWLDAEVKTETLIVHEDEDYEGVLVVRVGADRVAAARADGVATLSAELMVVSAGGREALEVPPQLLEISGDNPRTEMDEEEDERLGQSVGARGVKESITTRITPVGRLKVIRGQRRTLRAQEQELETVPVVVEALVVDDGEGQQRDDLAAGLAENLFRAAMSRGDLARGARRLLDLGLPIDEVAAARGIDVERARQEVKVAGSAAAGKALANEQLDMDDLLTLAELEEHDPLLAEQLRTQAEAQPSAVYYKASALWGLIRWRELAQRRVAELREAGVVAYTQPEDEDAQWPGVALDDLRATPDGEPGVALTEEEHLRCPGHAVVVLKEHVRRYDADKPPTLDVQRICTDYVEHGHAQRNAPPGTVAPDPEELKAEEMAAAIAARDEKRQQLRRVRDNNAAMAAANEARQKWLRAKFLTLEAFKPERRFPDDALPWAKQIVLGGRSVFTKACGGRHRMAHELLGRERDWLRATGKLAEDVAKATGTAFAKYMLAFALGAWEEQFTRETWRYGGEGEQEYLRHLARWGYELQPVEQEFVDR